MRSPVDRPRLELLLRCMALGALLWLTVEALSRRSARSSVELTDTFTETVLARWSTNPPADTLSLPLRAAPAPLIRDWLVALRRAGLGVRWSDGGIPPLMIEMERRPDPAGAVSLSVAGPVGAAVLLSDDLGPLDSLRLGALGASVRLAAVAGTVRATIGSGDLRVVASSTPPPIVNRRHLVLFGAAGWESKFVVAALEERGWAVDSRLAVAPGIAVIKGKPFPLDTARQAAVVALDSTAATYAGAIVSFVRQGGGVLLGPDGTSGAAALRALAPGRGGVVVHAALRSGGSMSRELLGLHDLAPLVADAIPLERRGVHVAVAVRRSGAGRVGQVGYLETWRWRMDGGTAGVAAHRNWWAALVASVAYGSELEADAAGDPAPRAALFSALGEPSPPARNSSSQLFPLVLALLFSCLFGEWASRRLRGAR